MPFCGSCGASLDSDAKFCPKCGAPVGGSEYSGGSRFVKTEKDEGLALILSFLICGLGQMYVGKIERGLIFLFGCVLSAVILWMLGASVAIYVPLLGLFLMAIGTLAPLAIWAYGMYDAYNLAKEYNLHCERFGQRPW
jgi:TM2 domain-containing membrane protein YozV